jgi:3-deoxy-7-phosphoheptulonate synthase
MHSAAHPNHFISVNPIGQVAVIRTQGNPNTHIVLRGGINKPNYDPESIALCEKSLARAGFRSSIMVDCSHANSQKDPSRQLDVIESVINQIRDGNRSIVALMIESNLNFGQQSIPQNPKDLKYGVSITDACIDWQTTERAVRRLREQLMDILANGRVPAGCG